MNCPGRVLRAIVVGAVGGGAFISPSTARSGEGIPMPSPSPTPRAHTLVFDEQGRLAGSPPLVVEHGDRLHLEVSPDAELSKASRRRLIDELIQSLDAVTEESLHAGPLAVWSALSLAPELDAYKASLREEVCAILKRPPRDVDTDDALIVTYCASRGTPPDTKPLAGLADAFGNFPADAFARIRAYRHNEKVCRAELQPRPEDPLAAPAGSPAPPTNICEKSTSSVEVVLPGTPNLVRVEYDLRRQHPYAVGLKKWRDAASPPPHLATQLAHTRKAFEDIDLKMAADFEGVAQCLARPASDFAAVPSDGPAEKQKLKAPTPACDRLNGDVIRDAVVEVATLTHDMRKRSAEIVETFRSLTADRAIRDWLVRWAWRTGSVPRFTPFREYSREAIDASLTAAKTSLLALEAQVAAQQRISVETSDPAGAADASRKLGEIIAERDAVRQRVAVLEGRLARAVLQYDDLLYQGLLLVSGAPAGDLVSRAGMRVPERQVVVMQHHDASRDFVVMGRGMPSEIRDHDRLYVLAENAAPDLQLRAVATVTPIQADLSSAAEELNLSGAGLRKMVGAALAAAFEGEPEPLPLDMFHEARSEFLVAYIELKAQLTYVTQEIVGSGPVWTPNEDTTPALVTRLVPQDHPGAGPATVEYTLKRKSGATETDVWKGKYRVNRLYRLRLQAGFVYDTLQTTRVQRKDDGSYGPPETREHGADLTFGTMIYLQRRDIRNASFAERTWPPSLYAGFSAREAFRNLFLGLAVEPLPAVSVVVGRHFSRTDTPIRDGNAIVGVDSLWKHTNWGKPFLAVTFDPVFFTRLFGAE